MTAWLDTIRWQWTWCVPIESNRHISSCSTAYLSDLVVYHVLPYPVFFLSPPASQDSGAAGEHHPVQQMTSARKIRCLSLLEDSVNNMPQFALICWGQSILDSRSGVDSIAQYPNTLNLEEFRRSMLPFSAFMCWDHCDECPRCEDRSTTQLLLGRAHAQMHV